MTQVAVIEATDAFTHVAVRGKLDAAGVGVVDLKLTTETVARHRPAVIDLSDVVFIASMGIGMLIRVAQALRGHGLRMAIVAKPSPVKDILDLMKMEALFPVVATREDALRILGVE